MKMLRKPHQWLLASAVLMAPAVVLTNPARASDHADTAQNFNGGRSVADLTDLHIFPSPTNAANVVLSMSSYGLIPAGQGLSRNFGTNVLYQFRIDTGGDSREDLVIQAKFEGTGINQRVRIAGPIAPSRTGATSVFEKQHYVEGTVNRTFEPTRDMKVFAGAREDPFFIDLERLFQIFPDRSTPILPPQPRDFDLQTPNPNQPRVLSFRPRGQARDFLANFNVMAIVIEMPRTMLRVPDSAARNANTAAKTIKVWMTTSVASAGGTFTQQDRLARPVVNEVFATVSNMRHEINNKIQPNEDPNQIGMDITNFMRNTAGRSEAITNVVRAVLVPDVMTADLSQPGRASYLGVETGGATGGTFGGRDLKDDVVDISLGVIFGNTIPALGLAPNDGRAIPALTTDNVGAEGKRFQSTFPYLGHHR